MAIYTKLKEEDVNNFFLKYDLGKVLEYKGIQEGIENTNYFIKTEKGKYILTIYEKRVNEKDLPFFINLMRNLYKFDFKCPRPIKNNDQNYITHIHGKNAAVVTFINGSSKKTLSPQNCYEVGVETAKLHLITKNMKINRDNSLSIKSWPKLFDRIKNDCLKIHNNMSDIIELSLKEIEKNWPKNLPSGIIHADLFPDNIFFKDEKISGIIDFYFSCNDFYCFEIAVCINALCFDGRKENLSCNITKSKKFLDGYSSIRKITLNEKNNLKILSQGAAMRFLLTRVFDFINSSSGAIVTIKDPIEYLKRLEFHSQVKDFNDYYI